MDYWQIAIDAISAKPSPPGTRIGVYTGMGIGIVLAFLSGFWWPRKSGWSRPLDSFLTGVLLLTFSLICGVIGAIIAASLTG
jgi:hypothetical protein